ncbi:MAG: adenosine kinase, partial [Caulobacteraceae bacterium]|nr:adenosine kinase [Caulobacter sp.]
VSMINVTPDGQRTMATFLGAASELTAADVDEDVVAAGSVVYLEGYLFDPPPAREAFAVAARAAHAAGRTVAITLSDAFVVERWRDELNAFLPEVDVLLANAAEVMALTRASDLDAALAAVGALVRIAAVTNGAEGSFVCYGGECTPVEAYPAERVVDTTGAGDQYAAGFLYGLSQGRSLDACARLGHLAAAEVIAHVGPRPQTSLAELARGQGLI